MSLNSLSNQTQIAQNQSFANRAWNTLTDGRIDSKEASQLKEIIGETKLSPSEKQALTTFIDKLSQATTGTETVSGFFGPKTEEISKKISPQDLKQLQRIASENPLANALLKAMRQTQTEKDIKPVDNNQATQRASSSFTTDQRTSFPDMQRTAPAQTQQTAPSGSTNWSAEGYNPELGATLARRSSGIKAKVGYCLAGVARTLPLAGKSACDAGRQLLRLGFKAVDVARDELRKLPAGAVVVWENSPNAATHSRGAGWKHGHISIADGHGREHSDRTRPQMMQHYAGGSYQVYLPTANTRV